MNEETRNISLTIDEARELYNSDNKILKEAVLQEFSREELEFSFKDVRSISDVLIQFSPTKLKEINEAAKYLNENQKALIILNMIREVLNKGYNMKAFEGNMYYPYNPLITLDSTYCSNRLKSGEVQKVAKVLIEGKEYALLGGFAYGGGWTGLLYFDSHYGASTVDASVGFLECATEEIAKHMSLYFAKEIFDAKYKGWINYEWI